MKIALDYDGTYTADPQLWDYFIAMVKLRGHEIVIVAMRYPTEPIEPLAQPIEVIYTSRQAKAKFYVADIWIDDHPMFVFEDSRFA